MLQHLQITNLAVVENIEIEFSANMTVITGETGAGKSILLDALGLALGARADSGMIRPGNNSAQVAATFNITALNGALLWLADCDLTDDTANQECIIRRVLYANGRSRAYINDKLVTTTQLRLLGNYLVQIHGQNQHQLLLSPHEQRRLLDAFGQHDKYLEPIKKAYSHYQKLNTQKQALLKAQQNTGQCELLRYQVEELTTLNAQENEAENLSQTHQKLAHANHHTECCQKALDALQTEESSAVNQLSRVEKLLPELDDPNLVITRECLQQAGIQLEEALQALKNFTSQIELDPEKLNFVEQRLEKLYDIARKHKIEPDQLHTHLEKLQKELSLLEDASKNLAEIDTQMHEAFTQYQTLAKPLSKARQKASKKLEKEITQRLQHLGMPGASLKVELVPEKADTLTPHGQESCHFLVTTNPGHPYQPLNKVVSGGELSRISLAIQLITAHYQESPTLVFDEVDVGVGGKIGTMIGKALRTLGQSVQVLCVTHLPQVASCGHHHLLVQKEQENGKTKTKLSTLPEKSRIEEIARMVGGMNVTNQARENAKHLLKQEMTETP